MGHAHRKQESFQSRTMLPPALPTRSGFAPKGAAPTTTALAHRVTPPPPPLAALKSAPAPKSPLPAADLKLAILPQWVDASAPLLPAKKSRFGLGFWLGSTTVSLAVGALVAAGLLGVHYPQSSSQPAQLEQAPVAHETQPQPVAHEQAHPQPKAAEAKPDLEIGTEEAFAAAAPSVVLVPEVTLTAKKIAKRTPVAKVKKQALKPATVVSTSWQPEPEATAETTAPAAAEQTAAAEPAPAAVPESAPAPEPVAAPEPPKPVLPEQLTRDQVRKGMEAKRNAVITCAKGAYGKVLADVTISQSGKVTSSVIDGTWAGTSVGSCMSSALRGAQFPEFSGPEIQVRYPFSF